MSESINTEAETIQLKLDETNELLFTMSIEGADPNVTSVRLFCESDGMSYVFEGKSEGDEIKFVIPRMSDKLDEGVSYKSQIEVIVENKHFKPAQFNLVFKPTAKIFVENMKVNNAKTTSKAPIIEFKRKEQHSIKENKSQKKNIPQNITSKSKPIKNEMSELEAKRIVDELLKRDF